ncbi:cob(I)yrinic acid a,c-diamide adenosyltransferase [Deinococcus radiomollis]|uniref:cob(I)yrinic acid a,c-diamide adenosyltransferase n=1 Tax=Deinococcus radiomollis TaxID=468916 RepID=UPI003892B82F
MQEDPTARLKEEAMKQLEAQRDAHTKKEGLTRGRRGLVIVNTGDGKGKTTAALGLMMRAHGRGLRVQLFQFIKHENAKFGEHRALEALGIPFAGLGDGFTWRSKDLESSADMAAAGWEVAKAAILSGEHDLVVLDEFTYALKYGWVGWPEVQEVLERRDPGLHVVITGRGALPELVECADTVTEMVAVKHAYAAGIGAQAGIEH